MALAGTTRVHFASKFGDVSELNAVTFQQLIVSNATARKSSDAVD